VHAAGGLTVDSNAGSWTDSETLLSQARDIKLALSRHRPRWALATSAASEHGLMIRGRYGDGALLELGVRLLGGTGLRCHSDQGMRFFASDSAADADDLVRELYSVVGTEAATSSRSGRDDSYGARRSIRSAVDASESISSIRRQLDVIDAAARGTDPAIDQVIVEFAVTDRLIALVPEDEEPALEPRSLAYLTVRATARRGTDLSTGFYTPAVRGEIGELSANEIGIEVARRAVDGLGARPAPVGHFPVVIGGGRGIVILHEACCHPLEADEVLRRSIYAGQVGSKIASEIVTIEDDPLAEAVGGYSRDDEGLRASGTTLVDGGVLRAFLTDVDSSLRLRANRTANGRCASALDPPLPRMTNTCLAAGSSTPEDIIAGTDFGIFARHVGGGEVTEATGEFVFRVTNGYLIRHGAITDPIKETTIAGRGADMLLEIDAVGNDVTRGAAMCGKFGQFVPVGVVGPTLRVRSLAVGGTAR
jgi:TldD protein